MDDILYFNLIRIYLTDCFSLLLHTTFSNPSLKITINLENGALNISTNNYIRNELQGKIFVFQKFM